MLDTKILPKPKIAVLTAHSLLGDGLASKLHEYSNLHEINAFGVQKDSLTALISFHPDVVILEDTILSCHPDSLQRLLGELPSLLIVLLNIGQSEIMVIHGEQHAANDTTELMKIIQRSWDMPAHQIA